MAVFDAGDSVVDAAREVPAELVSAVGSDDAGASREGAGCAGEPSPCESGATEAVGGLFGTCVAPVLCPEAGAPAGTEPVPEEPGAPEVPGLPELLELFDPAAPDAPESEGDTGSEEEEPTPV